MHLKVSTDHPHGAGGGGRVAWRCTCFNVRHAAREVTRFYDSVLAPSGVTATRFTLLGAIALSGEMPVTGLAEALALDRTTLSRNLRHLADEGLVRLAPGADKRARIASLTAAGEAALNKAMPYWQDAQRRIADALGTARWSGMLGDMADLADLAALKESTSSALI